MGIKQIPVTRFLKWLEGLGLIEVGHSSSHWFYNYPEKSPKRLTRNVSVRKKYKDIPILHIHTNLKTLGISKAQFEEEIQEF
jgi:hypothetical protein